MKFSSIIHLLLAATITLALAACADDAPVPDAGRGTLQLTLSEISAATRATPAELGAPTADDFSLAITNSVGRSVYDGAFTTQEFTVPTGTYAVRATYGSNPLLGTDTPFYIAEAEASVQADQTCQIPLSATVGNALVSVRFGVDDAELARFNRFYSDYALYVAIGNQSIPITRAEPAKSVYVRAGSAVSLRFWGRLRLENDREVQTTLTAEAMPNVLEAADHAIVTLTLPEPESALTVSIAKVELQELVLDETIPLSWLPVAMTLPLHQYDAAGNLVGTNLLFTESYPGMKWRAVVTNDAGTTVRAVEGNGALESLYSANAEWPYLPQGNYKSTYYIYDSNDVPQLASSRDFTVPAPTIRVSADGFTSYDKYLAGDIAAANACDRLTVYEPTVALSVSNALLNNPHYSYTFTYSYDGTSTPVQAGSNSYSVAKIEHQSVRREPYVLRADATFDGVAATAQKDFRITGLPYSLDLKNHGEWDSSGGVDWFDNDVRLGHLSTGGQNIRTDIAICLPPATYFCADYDVNVHSATIGTTFTINVGTAEILRIREDGGIGQNKDNLHSGTTATYHDDNQYTTSISCNNSYGAGQTCTHIYALTLKYASH